MSNLKKFIKQVETNTCFEGMVVDLTPAAGGSGTISTGPFFRYWGCNMRDLAKALSSGNCKPGLTIDLRANYLGNGGAKALAVALKSPNRPENLWLDLDGNKISDEGFRALLEAIVAGPSTPGLRLDINGEDAIENLCGCGFGSNHITDTGASYLGKALEELIVSDKCPQNLHINLKATDITSAGGNSIAMALESAIAKSKARHTIRLDLPSSIGPTLQERIMDDLSKLRNRSNAYAPTLYAAQANTVNAHQPERPAPSVSARI